jgi:hypothetical protein
MWKFGILGYNGRQIIRMSWLYDDQKCHWQNKSHYTLIIKVMWSLCHFQSISLQGILSIPTHVFATSIQINHFYNFRYDCPPWHLLKMTGSRINDYKVVCSCICNLYLQLMSIWMKMKMKNTLISSFLMATQNRSKCSCFCDLEGGSKAIGYHVASFQLDLWLQILVANAHVIKC